MQKFMIDYEEVTEKEFYDELEASNRYECEEEYEELLREEYGDVEICGYVYDAAYALREVDPIAYQCGLSDFETDKYDERSSYLEDGIDLDIDGKNFWIEEIDDEDDEEEEDDDDCEEITIDKDFEEMITGVNNDTCESI